MLRVIGSVTVLVGVSATTLYGGTDDLPDLLPVPKQVTRLDGRARLSSAATACIVSSRRQAPAVRTGIRQLTERVADLGLPGLPVVGVRGLHHALNTVVWVGTTTERPELAALFGSKLRVPEVACVPDGYILHVVPADGLDLVLCLGHDLRGCYYGLQTLIQLLSADKRGVSLPRVEIVDWPTYRVRLVKTSAVTGEPAVMRRFAEVLPRYKLNVYGLQYHSERGGTWREPSQRYVDTLEQVGALARRDGVLEPGLFVCPFLKPRIDLTKPDDVEVYLDRLRWGIRNGFRWVEIDLNDWAKWEYLSKAEKARFADIGDFTANLTNTVHRAMRRESLDTGVILCPAMGWYHGPVKPELVSLCQQIPDDVLVYWTGPVVRSRRITAAQVEAWTQATGRKPFLWDNTLYAHFQPAWVGYAFNPYHNDFPPNLPELLAGPGIHLNANALPEYLPGLLTFADYMWNPEAYDPQRSIRAALRLCWGDEAPETALAVQERMIAVHRLLYEVGRGWGPWDKAQADSMVAQYEQAAARLSEIAGDDLLTARLDEWADELRKAVADFRAPDKRTPRPTAAQVTKRPLSEGAVNPSAEEVVNGKPVAWSLYSGAGTASMSLSDDAHRGEHSVCLQIKRWYHDPEHPTHGDRKWINVALVHGSDGRGFDGADAYDVESDTAYRCSFWLKSTMPVALLGVRGWSAGTTAAWRHELNVEPAAIRPTNQWRRYTASFRTAFDTTKVVLLIGLKGYEDEGTELGTIWVDDVLVEPVSSTSPRSTDQHANR